MTKQELIDKVVNELKGLDIPIKGIEICGKKISVYQGYLVEWDGIKPISLCKHSYLSQRARELGWINGHKWGKEYETNDKKPDLPDDVNLLCEYKSHSIYEETSLECSEINWVDVLSFRIVDERYKPAAELVKDGLEICEKIEKKLTSVDNDWHIRGEWPPVGVECEILQSNISGDLDWVRVKVIAYTEKSVVIEMLGSEILRSRDFKFRPIKSERERFIEAASRVLHQTEGGIINDISLGQMYDVGFRQSKDEKCYTS